MLIAFLLVLCFLFVVFSQIGNPLSVLLGQEKIALLAVCYNCFISRAFINHAPFGYKDWVTGIFLTPGIFQNNITWAPAHLFIRLSALSIIKQIFPCLHCVDMSCSRHYSFLRSLGPCLYYFKMTIASHFCNSLPEISNNKLSRSYRWRSLYSSILSRSSFSSNLIVSNRHLFRWRL